MVKTGVVGYFRDVSDFIRLEHTVFDLPFVWSGLVVASAGNYDLTKFILVTLAAIFARATAMTINRIEGRKYDMLNPRKKNWQLISGRFSMRFAVFMAFLFAALFELSVFFINTLVIELSPVVLVLFVTDPLLKRFTSMRHFYMGFTIGVGVMAGYLSVIPAFPVSPVPYLILIAASLWIAGFDMIYVIPDIDTDIRNGLKTVMTDYGIKKGHDISILTHAVSFMAFLAIAFFINSVVYYVVLAVIGILMLLQHISLDPSDVRSIRFSFLGANSMVGIMFLVAMIFAF
ncbi:MAG: putative 4-hydroxybenzoate polyprenyltransferase [Candidatus Thermoplasmatota archaeon]|nr:putative 4-hydroxybenzoate polyprenyltransferase [Candidatus Thermoplasmatota archaeon]MCL5730601.1 putative 4-hydroxybenzoate polyprenyltransferase [Candidatus Thermoplasmatota archaeon]